MVLQLTHQAVCAPHALLDAQMVGASAGVEAAMDLGKDQVGARALEPTREGVKLAPLACARQMGIWVGVSVKGLVATKH